MVDSSVLYEVSLLRNNYCTSLYCKTSDFSSWSEYSSMYCSFIVQVMRTQFKTKDDEV